MKKKTAMWIAIALLSGFPVLSDATEIDPELLEKTVRAARANVVPAEEVKVIYEPMTEHLYVSFATPPDYRQGDADEVWRWRSNQWSVLQEFMLSRIPVKWISVETNDLKVDRLLRYTHSSMHADKYGDIRENRLWLRTATVTQKKRGGESWEKVD